MHKFKNKHTDEIITTPYLAEAEEYRSNDNYIEVNMSKPVYTKEMHERGELPPVGSIVKTANVDKVTGRGFNPDTHCVIDLWGSDCECEVLCHTDICGTTLPVVKHKASVSSIALEYIKPIPTIEDELVKLIDSRGWYGKELANALVDKYNITPKES